MPPLHPGWKSFYQNLEGSVFEPGTPDNGLIHHATGVIKMNLKDTLKQLRDCLHNPDFWVLLVSMVLAPMVVFN
jgi:hypothetical protein